MKIFSIAGWSESGKTTLITRLIHAFRKRGKRVVAVKKTHEGFDLEPEAKDSRRFLAAGAAETFIVSGSELLHLIPLAAGENVFLRLKSLFLPEDIVLMEGLYHDGIPVIEVWKPSRHEKPKFAYDSLAALVSDEKIEAPVPCLDSQNLDGIVRFIEEYDGKGS